jgi:hypothetical protein
MSISNPIDALKNIAPRRVDGHDQFRDRRRSRHEALGRIEVDGALVGQHRIGFAPYALKEIASAMGPPWLKRRSFDLELCHGACWLSQPLRALVRVLRGSG